MKKLYSSIPANKTVSNPNSMPESDDKTQFADELKQLQKFLLVHPEMTATVEMCKITLRGAKSN